MKAAGIFWERIWLLQRVTKTWRDHHRSLMATGIKMAGLTVSDKYEGLVNIPAGEYSGSSHQRCTVHFERNVFSKVPYKERKIVGDYLK